MNSQEVLPAPMNQNESLAEREDILFDELSLAIQFDRPSILIAVYESEYVREEVSKHLADRLKELGQDILNFHIDEKLFDVPLILAQNPDHERTVYFITGLKWGGGKGGFNAYRALNMRREFFVDNLMRVVLWLTRNEASQLPRHAPDFWAFRHRVVELMDSPVLHNRLRLDDLLTWDGWKATELLIDVDQKIPLRESMLTDLPDGIESKAAHTDLIYSLASFYWAKGNYPKSIQLLEEDLKSAAEMNDRLIESQLRGAVGLVLHCQGLTTKAITSFEKAVELNPYNTYAWTNMAIARNDQGEHQEAIDVCRKSIELKPGNSQAYSILGDIYRQLGQWEYAKDCYQTATRLEPKVAGYWIDLGDIQYEQKRDKEALRAYLKASRLDGTDPVVWARIGQVYKRTNRFTEAKKAFRKAQELSPENTEVASVLDELENSLT